MARLAGGEFAARFDEFKEASERYAAPFDKGDLPMPRPVAVVTYMDARLHPEKFLGLELGTLTCSATPAAGPPPGYLTTLVKRQTGRTVLGRSRSAARPRRLLVQTDESVERIGVRVGYDILAYFACRFRSDRKATPASWRTPTADPAPRKPGCQRRDLQRE